MWPPPEPPPGSSDQGYWSFIPNPYAGKGGQARSPPARAREAPWEKYLGSAKGPAGRVREAPWEKYLRNDSSWAPDWWEWQGAEMAAGKCESLGGQPKRRKMTLPDEDFEADPEVQETVERFLADNEVDERAQNFLRKRRPDVQLAVVEQGSLSDARKPSSALMSRIANVEEALAKGAPIPKLKDPELDERLELFLLENPVDEKAQRMLRTQKQDVKRAVLARGNLTHCNNSSAALMKRVFDVRDAYNRGEDLGFDEHGAPHVPDPEVSAAVDRFLDENPVDPRASDMLRSQRPDVQVSVMQQGGLMHCSNSSAALLGRIRDTAKNSKGSGNIASLQVSSLFWWKDFDPADIGIGRVKLTQPQKGFSFLSSAQAPGQDIYAFETVINPELLHNGDILAFKFHHEAEWDGPEADAPVWKLVGPISGSVTVAFGDFRGQINKVMDNGSGFVNCPEATAIYGKNTFIHSQVMQQCGLEKDDVIAFQVHVNKQEQPQVSSPVWKCLSDMSAAK